MMTRKSGLFVLLVANVVCWCMLGFYQTGTAQMSAPKPTLADPTKERERMDTHLEEIKALLREQNAILKSGDVKVIVVELPKTRS